VEVPERGTGASPVMSWFGVCCATRSGPRMLKSDSFGFRDNVVKGGPARGGCDTACRRGRLAEDHEGPFTALPRSTPTDYEGSRRGIRCQTPCERPIPGALPPRRASPPYEWRHPPSPAASLQSDCLAVVVACGSDCSRSAGQRDGARRPEWRGAGPAGNVIRPDSPTGWLRGHSPEFLSGPGSGSAQTAGVFGAWSPFLPG
jgi:hypothetical protein